MSSSGQHNRDTTSEASTLLAAITKFEYVVTLVTVTNLLGYMKQLSTSLQGRQLDVVAGFDHVRLVEQQFSGVRLIRWS